MKMEEVKNIRTVINEEYLRIVPGMANNYKNKNIAAICKYKCLLFTAAGEEGE